MRKLDSKNTALKIHGRRAEGRGVRTIATILLGLLLGCAKELPPELLGRWKSDAERTLADIDARQLYTDKQRAILGKMFGDLMFEFRDDGTFDWTFEKHTETATYRVLAVHPAYVELEAYDAAQSSIVPRRLWLEPPDSFWIWAGPENRRFKEYFRRMQ